MKIRLLIALVCAVLFFLSCEQEIPVSTQDVSQPQATTAVAAEHTEMINAVMTVDVMLRNPVFSSLGFVKDESTGDYIVDTNMFNEVMSDDSFFDKFLTEDFDDIVEGNEDLEWFRQYLDSTVPVELEEVDIDFRGKKWYCCTVCCYPADTGPSGYIAYKKSKRKRKWGARLWCGFRLILHSIGNQPHPCGHSLREGDCIPNSCN